MDKIVNSQDQYCNSNTYTWDFPMTNDNYCLSHTVDIFNKK